jgi:hypothetical protein
MDRLGPIVDKQIELGTDWGANSLWCGAAKHYIAYIASNPRPSGWLERYDKTHTNHYNHTNHTSCGIVLVPIDHTNSRTIEKSTAFLKAGYDMWAFLEEDKKVQEWSVWDKITASSRDKAGEFKGMVYGPPSEHFVISWETVPKPNKGLEGLEDCTVEIRRKPAAAKQPSRV